MTGTPFASAHFTFIWIDNICNTIIEKKPLKRLHLIRFYLLHALIGSNSNMSIHMKRHLIFDFTSFNCLKQPNLQIITPWRMAMFSNHDFYHFILYDTSHVAFIQYDWYSWTNWRAFQKLRNGAIHMSKTVFVHKWHAFENERSILVILELFSLRTLSQSMVYLD